MNKSSVERSEAQRRAKERGGGFGEELEDGCGEERDGWEESFGMIVER